MEIIKDKDITPIKNELPKKQIFIEKPYIEEIKYDYKDILWLTAC